MNEPICADCENLIGVRTHLAAAKDWKCGAPENIQGQHKDPVSGLAIMHYMVSTCYNSRQSEAYCGAAGKWFKPYTHPAAASAPARGKQLPSAESLLGELGL